jgi:hypothetical protein
MAIDYEVRDGIAYISFCRTEGFRWLADVEARDKIAEKMVSR